MKARNTLILTLFPFLFVLGQSTIVDYTIIGNESSENSTDLDTLSGFFYQVGNTNECESNDGFVIKYKDDSIYKRKIIGSESIEVIETIETTTSDSIYVGGYTNINNDYDIYLAKLDTQLNVIKTKVIELINWNFCYDIVIDNNNVIGVGKTHNNTDYDPFIFKIDNNLDTLWTNKIELEKNQKLNKVIAYNDSIYIACGFTTIDGLSKEVLLISFNSNTGDTLWTNHYGGVNDDFCSSIIKTNDGGIAGFGTTSSYTSSNEDTFLFKVDSAGVFLWSNLHQVQSPQNIYNDNGIDLVQLQNGDYVVAAITGSFGGPDIQSTFIIKTNPSGVFLDGFIYDGGKDHYPTTIIKTTDSTFFVGGTANAKSFGYTDSYLLNIKKIAVNNTVNEKFKLLERFCFTTVEVKQTDKPLTLFPNPFTSSFIINGDINKQLTIKVYNLLGGVVFEAKTSTNQIIEFPKNLPFGSYIIAIKDKSTIEYIKIIYAQ